MYKKEMALIAASIVFAGCAPVDTSGAGGTGGTGGGNNTPAYDADDRWTTAGYVEDTVNTANTDGTWVLLTRDLAINSTATDGSNVVVDTSGDARTSCIINALDFECHLLEGGFWNAKTFTTDGTNITSNDGTIVMLQDSTTHITGTYSEVFPGTLVPNADFTMSFAFEMVKLGGLSYSLGSRAVNVDSNAYDAIVVAAFEMDTNEITTVSGAAGATVDKTSLGVATADGNTSFDTTDAAAKGPQLVNIVTPAGIIESEGAGLFTSDVSEKGEFSISYSGTDSEVNSPDVSNLGAYDGSMTINF